MAINHEKKISSYILGIKDWKIQEIISGYVDAFLIFNKSAKTRHSQRQVAFSQLRKMSDIFYDAKENFHLIFKRLLNPKKQIFEQVNKLTPHQNEINFMNNVGLLFHRVMIARELKYLLDSYEKDSEFYQDTQKSFEINIHKIAQLFEQGTDLLLKLLADYINNINLIAYFIDNKADLLPILEEKYNEILRILTGSKKVENAYLIAAQYYVESGWFDKAIALLKDILKIDPQNTQAFHLLESLTFKDRGF